MRRNRFILFSACIAVGTLGITASMVIADNVHFQAAPTFTDKGVTLTAQGTLVGLGSTDITIQLSAVGYATSTCTNPSDKQAPGQNRVPVATAVSQKVPASEIKNGSYKFTLTTPPPPTPTAKQAGCPSNNWSASINDVVFTSATITVTQTKTGKEVLKQTFKF